ncbi:hypothetical protein [Baekduia sp. Peel2402]|uniref:hypothetical protein n=1 Tax=Baekduia sp. Peel2402 TaxID=3458296 RepID=UPI00403E3A6D
MARKSWVNAERVLFGALSFLAFVVLGVFASSATAATPGQSYGYTSDIGTPDTGSWGIGANFSPVSISLDDGNVFIIRQTEFSIDVLNPAGTSISRPSLGVSPSGVAASPDGSTVFVLDAFGPTIVKLTSDGAPTPTYTQDPLWTPGVALNQIGGLVVDPVTGDLVVGAAGGIHRFDAASGAELSSFDGSTSDGGAFTPTGIAIAPNQDIYAVAAPGRVEHMGANGSWKGSLQVPIPESLARPIGIAVNPQNGEVAVELRERADTIIRLYTAANALKDSIVIPSAVAADSSGLAYSPDGSKLYVGLTNGSAHIFTFGTRPGVDAPVVSQIAATGAHLSGVVATDGQPSTAWIEYCLASDPCERYQTSDGSSPWHRLPPHTNLSDPTQDSIVEDLTGLDPNTRYLVRTYAINDTSKVEALSAAEPFRTALDPPVVTTGGASPDDASAELTGTIGTFGDQTTYHFEYGLTTNYGSRVPANREAVAGNSRTPRTFSQTAKGLQPGTEYHYRLAATNAAGTTYGADRTFTTLGVDQVAPHRAYEQATSPNKNGLALFNNWGFQAKSDGSGIVYSAAAPAADASSASQASRYVTSRDPGSNWTGQKALDPPLAPTRAIMFAVTQAVSGDLKHTFVVSQKALTPDAVESAGNYYINDVDTGQYHLIGTTTQPGAFAQLAGPLSGNSFIAGADDFSWVVLISRYPLIAGAPQVAMYKWTKTGGLSLISRLPNGNIPTGDTWVQSSDRVANRLVSDDGKTWAFSLTSGEEGVYLRRSNGDVIAVSRSQVGGSPTGSPQPGIGYDVSSDGNYVIFQSSVQLTADATAGGPMMYRYDASSGGLEYLGPLDTTNDGSSDVLGVGNDGRTVYFNSNNQLVAWHDGQLDVVFPAKLSGGDFGYASPNGRYFNYLTSANLTTRDGTLRLYDAVAGDDVCLACTVDGTSRPGGLPVPSRTLSNRFPQVVTDDGHAYFDTTAALLSADHNGSRDVYEYYKGRLTLISPGDRDFTATLADSSADGSSVFFTTSEGLVGQDTDQTYDLYAARVGGGLAAQNPAPPNAQCAKAECGEPGPGPIVSPPVGSPPQPGTKSKRTNQEKVQLSVTRVSVGAKTVKITLHASQRGRITISGDRVVRTYRNVTKEGTYSVSVRLSKKAQSMQRAKKKFKLAVKVSLAGGWGTASAKYSRTLNK